MLCWTQLAILDALMTMAEMASPLPHTTLRARPQTAVRHVARPCWAYTKKPLALLARAAELVEQRQPGRMDLSQIHRTFGTALANIRK
jgi:hypothetical protein